MIQRRIRMIMAKDEEKESLILSQDNYFTLILEHLTK